jgi:hypothetical protein
MHPTFPVSLERPIYRSSSFSQIRSKTQIPRLRSTTTSNTPEIRSSFSTISLRSLSTMLFNKGKDSAPPPTKKLSLASLLSLQSSSDVDESPSPSSSESSSPLSLSISHGDLSVTDASSVNSCEDDYLEDDNDERTDRFQEKSYLSTRHGMKLHPYHDEAPYMQAYDPMLLEK